MHIWTVERRTAFGLSIVFILLGILNLTTASMAFRFSRSLAFAMLNMTLFFSLAAFIVVRRIAGILLRTKTAADSNFALLQLQESKHSQLIRCMEQVTESIVITDLEGLIVYVNPAFETTTGYARVECVGANARIMQSGQHPASFYQTMRTTLLRGETWSGDLINKRKDGTLFNEVATISPIKDENGHIFNFVAVQRDINHESLLRNQLKQAQKMEAMGRLAGGVAHDFNNLLMVIRTYTEDMQNHLSIQGQLRGNAEEVLKAVDRGASLTSQMLAFSRKQMICPMVLDLNDIIDDTAKMLRRVIGENIEFQLKLSKPIWTIEADRDQIVQVLMNLCINARDAMPRGGTLKITTENVTVGENGLDIPTYISHGDYVMLLVSDSGTGVSKEIQDDIFEPFFTTKGVGQGTGLGLATVYGIVKQSGGYVWLESELGQGARLTIYLPKVDRVVTHRVSTRAEVLLGGMETLLVVEDEGILCKGFCKFLNSLGYSVLSAGSGEEALSIVGAQVRVDLLLTDVILPKMNGRELSECLSQSRHGLKVIYMSGYTDDAVLRSGINELHTVFLQKPFGLGALASKVRETLEWSESASQSATL